MTSRSKALVTVLALAAALASGCSEEGGSGTEPTPSSSTAPSADPSADAAAITALVGDLSTALDTGQYADACGLLSTGLQRQVVLVASEALGKPDATCAEALAISIGGPVDTDAEVTDVEVTGDTATAQVGGNPWAFSRTDGTWLVEQLD